MRLWSLHPSYLDRQGLLAVWREGLLAKKVLEGKTKGYRNHPQLNRFKEARDPLIAINYYLYVIADAASDRGYNFDRSKLLPVLSCPKINVTSQQIDYEKQHLLTKLESRDQLRQKELMQLKSVEVHPLFKVVKGRIADWEIIGKPNK